MFRYLPVILPVALFFSCSSFFPNGHDSDPSSDLPAGPAEPTAFDNSVFTGSYSIEESDSSFRFVGKIGVNGTLSELAMEEEGALFPSGYVDQSGDMKISGKMDGLSHTYSVNFSGSVMTQDDPAHYSGSGNLSGSIETAVSTKTFTGTWSVEGEPIVLERWGNQPLQFLCWTGSGYDTLREFKLLRMNGTTGAVSVVGGSGFYPRIFYSPDSTTLYGIGTDLVTIDPQNGAVTEIGKLRQSAPDSIPYILMSDAAFSPDGILYAKENGGENRIFTVDTATAEISHAATPVDKIGTIAFARQGTLYNASGELKILDPKTFALRNIVGPCKKSGGSLFFATDGRLMTCNRYPATEVRSINVLTGETAVVVSPASGGIVTIVQERLTGGTAKRKTATTAVRQQPVDREYLVKLERLYREGKSVVDF